MIEIWSIDGPKTSLTRHPALHYFLLAALGGFGVWVSMPIFFRPQSTIESIDLAINIAIFLPSIFIAVVAGLLAIFFAVFSYRPDETGWFANLAHAILAAFGLRRLLLAEFVTLSPLRLLRAILDGGDAEGPGTE